MKYHRLDRLIDAGARLATIAFNLKQLNGKKLDAEECQNLARCQEEWDAALRSFCMPEELSPEELAKRMNEGARRA